MEHRLPSELVDKLSVGNRLSIATAAVLSLVVLGVAAAFDHEISAGVDPVLTKATDAAAIPVPISDAVPLPNSTPTLNLMQPPLGGPFQASPPPNPNMDKIRNELATVKRAETRLFVPDALHSSYDPRKSELRK